MNNTNANRYAEIIASNAHLSVVVERGSATGAASEGDAVRIVAVFANHEQAVEFAAETSRAWGRRLDAVRVVDAGRRVSAHDMSADAWRALGFALAAKLAA